MLWFFFKENERVVVGVEGLINCMWYVLNVCCKRIEVIFVFFRMLFLYGVF